MRPHAPTVTVTSATKHHQEGVHWVTSSAHTAPGCAWRRPATAQSDRGCSAPSTYRVRAGGGEWEDATK